jgi:diguanylate cyclase (GGDEF)-like protein/PAS domain S-box-containing protein
MPGSQDVVEAEPPGSALIRQSVPVAGHEDYLRGHQVHAAEQNVERGLVGFTVAAAVSVALFYTAYGNVVLFWFCLVTVFSLARIAVARGVTRFAPKPITRRQAWRYPAWCVLSGSVMLSFPSWIIMQDTGLAFAFMLALSLGTFWSASFVHAPFLPSAIAFMSTQLVVSGIAFAIDPALANTILFLLFVIGGASGYTLIRQHSQTFAQTVLQQMAMEKQSEVIGLLLREHEDQSSDWLWQTDASMTIMSPSSRFVSALGLQASALQGQSIALILRESTVPENAQAVSELVKKMSERQPFRDHVIPVLVEGQRRWFSVSGRAVEDPIHGLTGFRGVMSDVTASQLAELEVRRLALHDALTGLPNRVQFSSALDAAHGSGEPFAILSIDLDGFKPINDAYGHPTGDAFLVEIARRFQSLVQAHEMISRFGGDEFVMLTRRCAPQELETLCEKLLEVVGEPVEIDRFQLAVGASIGVALAPKDGATPAELLKNVDAALYRAKRDGRGTFRFFQAEMDMQVQAQSRLAHGLRQALNRRELTLLYQPFVDVRSGAVNGCEALIRWHHAERGIISPAEFIPLAEATGLIVPIGEWILEEACRAAAQWPDNRRVAVNISPVQFRDHDLPERILAALLKTGLSPARLEIEVTESLLVEDVAAAVDILRRVRALGVRVALDDFGTGYSALGYLRLFPFTKIKIDRSFIAEISERPDCQIIVRAIRDIAKGLGMTITAEGVETEIQAALLRETGCNEFQGFLFSRPLSESGLNHWDRWQPRAA